MWSVYKKPVARTKGYYTRFGKIGYKDSQTAAKAVDKLAELFPGTQFISVLTVDDTPRIPLGEAEQRYAHYAFTPVDYVENDGLEPDDLPF